MEFTLEELRDIYWALLDCNDVELLKKIELVYTFCGCCNQLIKNDEFDQHLSNCSGCV